MIYAAIINLILINLVYSYSFLIKKFFNLNYKNLTNLDFFFGYFFIIFIIIFYNFFFPAKNLFLILMFLSVPIQFYLYKKKILQINNLRILILLLLFQFLAYSNGNNVDSPMYHLQILKWIETKKIVFGLSNLEIRFGMNSTWHLFVSALSFNFFGYETKYYLHLIVIVIAVNQIFCAKIKNISSLFLILSLIFLFIFSFIHPFNNGIILNHLGNPESDIVPMILFILSFYIFILLIEKNNSKEIIYLLLIVTFSCITSRLTYLGVFLLLIYGIFVNRKNLKINTFFIFSFLICLVWITRTFILSGCLLFPIDKLCFETSWSPGVEKIKFYADSITSFARDTPLRNKYLDFDYTLNSISWLKPWFKQYFLETSLLIISFSLTIIFCILIFFTFLKKDLSNQKILVPTIISILLSVILWMNIPEVRFGWGIFISLPMLLGSFVIYDNFQKHFNKIKFLKHIFVLCVLLISFKNFNYNKLNNIYLIQKRIHLYDNIKFVKNINGFEVYRSYNWQCADFNKICVNTLNKNLKIKKKLNYLFIYG